MIDGISYIYALVDPRSDAVFYVGVSKRPLRRVYSHAKTKNHRLRNVLLELQSQDRRPRLRILEAVTGGARAKRENYWILYHLNLGINLCNSDRIHEVGRRLSLRKRKAEVTHASTD